jgi:hypothetical protein
VGGLMVGIVDLAKALHKARREILLSNHFRFIEFELLPQIDRDVLHVQAVTLLEEFNITPKLEVTR